MLQPQSSQTDPDFSKRGNDTTYTDSAHNTQEAKHHPKQAFRCRTFEGRVCTVGHVRGADTHTSCRSAAEITKLHRKDL